MTSTVQKIGINIGGSSTDQVKFSTLRDTFFQTDPNVAYTGSATIKASDLLRTTTLPSDGGPQTNPEWVPDATENSNILTFLGNNWRVSHFQQSVKWYNIVQSGTDLNYSIDGQSWNSNLTKNVVKRMKVTGTLGSDSTSTSATFSGSAYNLRIEVSGNIYGYGGRGGGTSGAPAISGETAGDALSVSASTGKVIIDVSGNIYGGGGGGEKGETGAPGSSGSCTDSFNTGSACDNAPGCPSGYSAGDNVSNGPCGTGRKMVPSPGEWGWGHYWQSYSYGTKYYRNCTITTTPPGGDGGAGGNGGPGRGYNNQTESTSGASGSSGGPAVACPSGFSGPNTSSGVGGDGGTGGSGGDWGSVGSNTPNTGNGGGAGKAVTGSNYSIIGSTGSDNIKGATS